MCLQPFSKPCTESSEPPNIKTPTTRAEAPRLQPLILRYFAFNQSWSFEHHYPFPNIRVHVTPSLFRPINRELYLQPGYDTTDATVAIARAPAALRLRSCFGHVLDRLVLMKPFRHASAGGKTLIKPELTVNAITQTHGCGTPDQITILA